MDLEFNIINCKRENVIMEKEFVPYKIALELAKLNFNEKCFGYYNEQGNYIGEEGKLNSNCNKPGMHSSYCTAPLYQQTFEWFRKKYKIYVRHDAVLTGHSQGHRFVLKGSAYSSLVGTTWCETYEDAELECIRQLIKIAKEKK